MHTINLVSKEARELLLAVLLFLIGQQLIDKLPDDLLGRGVQHREYIHDQGVHVPAHRTAEIFTVL